MNTAKVVIHATHKNDAKLTYYWNGVASSNNTQVYTTTTATSYVTMSIKGDDGSELVMDEIDFHWNAGEVLERKGDYRNGQKGSIIEFFGFALFVCVWCCCVCVCVFKKKQQTNYANTKQNNFFVFFLIYFSDGPTKT